MIAIITIPVIASLLTTTAAAALANPFGVGTLGSAIIVNNCNVPVYVWTVDQNRFPDTHRPAATIAPHSKWSEKYYIPKAGGVSLKLSKVVPMVDNPPEKATITQFEYTANLTQALIYYDISNVNCQGWNCPFAKDGMHVATDVKACLAASCRPNEVPCTQFYNNWNDDWATKGCNIAASATLTLCYKGR